MNVEFDPDKIIIIMNLIKRSVQKFNSTVAPSEYPLGMKLAHWGMAVGLIGGVFFVKKAQW